jgi:hypothetical protein
MYKNPDLKLVLLVLLMMIFSCAGIAKAKLSSEEETKLNELINLSRPTVSIFGKINEPLKAGVSVLDIVPPQTIDLQVEKPVPFIKLEPKSENTKDLKELESERDELKKAEVAGLNFIQPSLALTEEEQKAIDEFFSRNEQEQLLNLWKSTIERNKTIQFIIQKLTPANSPQAANSILSRTLGAAIFLPFYTLQALSNNAGAIYGSQVGGRVLGSVIEGRMKKTQAEMQLSQTETIILFMMIDEVAERLRQRYHGYKNIMVERSLASNELNEAKKDTLDAQESNSPGAGVLADIQRRSIEREIRRLDAQLRTERNALVELAGLQAVGDLDQQLKLELAAAGNTPLDFLGVENR